MEIVAYEDPVQLADLLQRLMRRLRRAQTERLGLLGLTPAQERVAALVLQGRSTREITGVLHISANTVQEHLTAVFDKVGVRSRRELAGRLLSDQH